MTRRIALEAAMSVPWAIYEPALRTILEIAAREPVDLRAVAEWKRTSPETLASRQGAWKEGTDAVQVRDGVGIVTAAGPIFRRANLMTELSGATALSSIAKDFTAVVEDPSVRSILLDLDTPGGEANGIGEFASMVRAACEKKPVTAYVGGTAASAGFWIASAANRIVMAPTAMVGSIGVVMACRDSRERDAKAGIATHEFVSSVSPLKRPDPATDEGSAAIQAMVDRLAEEFVGAVASFRGVSPETVAADFGRGGMLIGSDAVDAGMADSLGSFEGLLSELSAGNSKTYFPTSWMPAAAASETQHMSKEQTSGSVGADTASPAAGAIVDPESLKAEGAVSAKARISAILKCEEAENRPKLANTLAFDTEMSVDEARKVLASAASESAAAPGAGSDPTGFKAVMDKFRNPQVGEEGGSDAEADDGSKALLASARAMGAVKQETH